jgi:D-alanine-D-alanine ligase
MDKKTRVLVCYNAPVSVYGNYSGKPKDNASQIDDMSETAFESEIKHVISGLREFYLHVEAESASRDIYQTITMIKRHRPDVIFNLVESVEGISSYEAYQAGLYELLRVSYTGNTPVCLGNCLNKFRTKQLLAAHRIPVPGAMVWSAKHPIAKEMITLRYPVITKLLKEDASIGISENSVVSSFEELETQLRYLDEHYQQPVLIEEYIEGREFNIAVLGGEALPISEISFAGLPVELPKIVTYEGKWISESVYYKYTAPLCPAPLSDPLRNALQSVALNAYETMACRDYARVDVRLDKNDTPYVIEVNPNPDISTDAGLARAARHAGYAYPQLLYNIAEFARARATNN